MTSGVKQTVIKNPTWWKRRTSMERCLTLTTSVTILIGISLVVALATVLYNREQEAARTPFNAEALTSNTPVVINALPSGENNKDNNVCLTPGCIHTASTVLKYMDSSVDPCEDFYKFTCGNFLKTTNIPDDKSSVTSFSLISDTLQEQLRSMIEEPIQENEPKPFQLTKKLYRACMNKTLIEKEGLDTIHAILKELGGWPVLEGDNWDEGDFDWRKSVYKFRKVGYSVDYFIDFSVGIDLKNSTTRVIDLDQASLGLRREFLTKGLKDKLVNAYYEYMVDIAVLFGADRDRATRELKESLNFEIALANISLPSEKRRNATALYNPMPVSELQQKFPSIPWVEYMNTLLAPDTKISNDELVIVSVPKYLTDFEALVSRTPKRVQANYVLWRAAASSVSYLTEELRKRQLDYTTTVTGKTERESRWKECIDISAGSLSIAAGALYVRKYFNENARQSALEMVADIRSEFQDILKNVDWMDDDTKKAALDKAKSMSTHIAYPDELLDNKKLEEFYGDLELDENHYLRSILNLTLFGTRFSFRRLRQPVNKTDWITHGRPAVVNAFYSSLENSIQFPAGILQGVFFDANRPRYMNYGAIGFVIGHEITHGFDDQGRQFDKNGNLVEWWALIILGLVAALAVVASQTLRSKTTLAILPSGDCNVKKADKVCLSNGCIKAAGNVLKFMDSSINPCEDFFEFACGNYIKTSKIPDDQLQISPILNVRDNVKEQLNNIIEQPIKKNDTKAFRLVKILYKACRNLTLLEVEGLDTFKAILKDFGGWPVLEGDNWNETNFSWMQTIYKYKSLGFSINYLIEMTVEVDPKNSSRRVLNLDQPSLQLERPYLIQGLDNRQVKNYFEYMVDIAVLLGADPESASKELEHSLIFEIALANSSVASEERRDFNALYNKMPVSELQNTYPTIPWMEYLNNLLSPDVKIDENQRIVVKVPSFFTLFENLMKSTPKRVQANYLIWRAVAFSVPHLNKKIRRRGFEYVKLTSGQARRQPRWKECIDVVVDGLTLASGALYIRNYFDEKSKHSAMEMVTDLRDEFEDNLSNVDWMDNKTKEAALDKAKAMVNHIAYPNEFLDNKKLDEYYKDLELDDSRYFRSLLNISIFNLRQSFKPFYEQVNKSSWISHGLAATVNAYYSLSENSITFPAGILQGVFFDENRPKYMNYAAIGSVIGHEITHGFDDLGSQFDKNGNLVEWRAHSTKKAFLKKARCIIDQYGNYTVPEVNINLNGVNTQGENIADNGGIKNAYLAYGRWTQRNGDEPGLPGIKYNSLQLFWISAAHIFCTKMRIERLKNMIAVNEHAPHKYRVLIPFSNTKYFAEDFDCPVGARMNPEKKCQVW